MMEHEEEVLPGLPEALPQGERLLWQGAPDWRTLALHAFHIRAVMIYFVALALWKATGALADGESFVSAMTAAAWAVPPGLIAVGLIAGYARLVQKTTVYSITSRRVVMRYGMAIPKIVNIPFRIIGAANLRVLTKENAGDIPMELSGPDKIAYLHIWPHARPWRFTKPQPMLRAIPHADEIARLLALALKAEVRERTGREANDSTRPVASPQTGTAAPDPFRGGMVAAE